VKDHDLTDTQDFIFVEITVKDPSEFRHPFDSRVRSSTAPYPASPNAKSAAMPNALAAFLLHSRD
jgi:hypothetical protein